jgi:heme-degrading monooxygenase HmoA
MFIAMNRFKVRKGEEPAFETRWRERMPGRARNS